MAGEISEEEKSRIKSMIDDLVAKAKVASEEYLKLDQETINNIETIVVTKNMENNVKELL